MFISLPKRCCKMIVRISLVILLSFSSACFRTSVDEVSPSHETPIEIPPPNVNLAKPLEISRKPADVSRCEKINRMIDESEFSNARWGVMVIGLNDGRIICSREAQKLYNPASIQKLLTSIVALDKLGVDFHWKTSVYSSKQIENGILESDLVLYGTGAPDFNESSLDKLVSELKTKGLQQIKGDIIGDESYFKGDKFGDGWTWNELQWYYGAEASALTFNENQTEISLHNGKPVSPTSYVKTSGEAAPVKDIEALGLKREIGENEVYVWGTGENLQAKISVDKSAFWAGKVFKQKLENAGILVSGETKFADWKTDRQFNISNANELTSIESKTLGEVVKKMNKDSVNLYAELILRTLGKRFGESAPDENPKVNKLRGDDLAGTAVIKKWLSENNIANEEIRIHDGSGLSRLDFITPEIIGRALVFASQSNFAEVFKGSLPVSGIDGTLRNRLKNSANKILAKTGSVMYVNSLAGYAQNSGSEIFVFVIMGNNLTQKNSSLVMVDSIAGSLVD